MASLPPHNLTQWSDLSTGLVSDLCRVHQKYDCMVQFLSGLHQEYLFITMAGRSALSYLASSISMILLVASRLHIPTGILRIPVFSVPVAFFSQESRFLFRCNFFRTSSGNLSVWGQCRKLHSISICYTKTEYDTILW